MIHREAQDGIVVLRMEHGKVNAIDTELCEQLLQHLKDDVRAIVLTGSGNAFSAGVDLMKVLNDGDGYIDGFITTLNRALRILFEFPRPVVAAMNGHAIAGGCIIACACDHRVMSQGGGRIGTPELQVGVPFPSSALEILRFAANPASLAMLLYSGKTVLPDEALQLGLIDEIVEPAVLLDRAKEMAATLACIPREAFALTKRQLRAPYLRHFSDAEEEVQRVWRSPETHAVIKQYLDRTLRKRQS